MNKRSGRKQRIPINGAEKNYRNLTKRQDTLVFFLFLVPVPYAAKHKINQLQEGWKWDRFSFKK